MGAGEQLGECEELGEGEVLGEGEQLGAGDEQLATHSPLINEVPLPQVIALSLTHWPPLSTVPLPQLRPAFAAGSLQPKRTIANTAPIRFMAPPDTNRRQRSIEMV